MEKDNEHMISLIGDIDRILNINGNEITSETDSQNQSQKSNLKLPKEKVQKEGYFRSFRLTCTHQCICITWIINMHLLYGHGTVLNCL